MQKWQYDVFAYGSDRDHDLTKLNELGQQGWEVCGSITGTSLETHRVNTLILKRPIE
ncbi:MAG: hypothetical protein WCT08_03470 [Patescibacteria group bacterium]